MEGGGKGVEQIQFYSARGEYGAFSDFARYPITLQGKVWATSEHYFQAQKFREGRDQEEIRKARPAWLRRWGGTAGVRSGAIGSR